MSMFERVVIFTTGGLILWENGVVAGNPLGILIRTVLMAAAGVTEFVHGVHKLHWTTANDCGLFFVAIHQKASPAPYVSFLAELKTLFLAKFKKQIGRLNPRGDPERVQEHFDCPFDSEYQELVRVFDSVKDEKRLEELEIDSAENSDPEPPKSPKSPGSPKSPSEKKPKKVGKVMRESWEDGKGRSGGGRGPVTEANKEVTQAQLDQLRRIHGPAGKVAKGYEDDWGFEDKKSKSIFSTLTSLSKFSLGSQSLDDETLAPVLKDVHKQLLTKNVAQSVADKLCTSVRQTLNGTKIGKLDRVSTTVAEAMEGAVEKLLTPNRNINILAEAEQSKKEKKPYVIVFCGVNGVGKTTTISKIAYWLKENGKTVMLVGGDTFRSGAVEQLRQHSMCIGVDLFEKGYGKDPANMAQEAINKAGKEGTDVVLVDTAGRMQDNEALLRELVKVVSLNQPNLLLFVGEALVGNDGVDQLVKFNQSLRDLSDQKEPRLLDGTVLTKFDTIDDKVGAAVNMVAITGQPIVFVGVGQAYTDLRKLAPRAVTRSLFEA